MEVLDLYDDNKKITGKTVVRGSKIEDGYHILLSVIFIKNSDGKYLIQKSSSKKDNLYSLTGGHVLANENSKDAIIREVKEELGLDIKDELIIYVSSLTLNTPIFDIYYLEKDIDLNTLNIEKDEVSNVYFMDLEKIKKLIENKNFKESHAKLFLKFINLKL